jgi:hypothetical protein
VLFHNIKFVPYFMKISQLVQTLKFGTHRWYDDLVSWVNLALDNLECKFVEDFILH